MRKSQGLCVVKISKREARQITSRANKFRLGRER